MLVIRKEQVEVFRRVLLEALDTRLMGYLREQPGSVSLTDAQLTSFIRRGMDDAHRFHLESETDLFHFIGLLAGFCGHDLQRLLPVQALQILLSYGIDPRLKLDQFASWVATSMTPHEDIR